MITAYEQTFDRDNADATDRADGSTAGTAAVHRQTYYLAVASFICNLVCTAHHHCIVFYDVRILATSRLLDIRRMV